MKKDACLADVLEAYDASFESTWSRDVAPEMVRFCVLDCETTGLDPDRHRIISIGALAVTEGQIELGDTLEIVLRVRFNTAATLVHGITRSETRDALEESDAIALLLAYLGDGIIVGHHISHDLRMIDAALARCTKTRLANLHLDTGRLMQHLLPLGVFGSDAVLADPSLDALCRFFGILPHDRHTAPGDAFLTAEIFIRQLRAARRAGLCTLAEILEAGSASTDG
jgi:DNA polymerase-3 subunit epsilon